MPIKSLLTPEDQEKLGRKKIGIQFTPEEQQKLQQIQQQVQQPEKKEGFLASLGKAVVRPFAELGTSAVNVAESIGDIARGDVAGASEALQKTRQVPLLGETTPAFTGKETTGEATKKMLGYGAEVGSYLPFGAGIAKVGQATLKGAVKQGAKAGVLEGAIGGALGGAGRPLQEGKGYGEAVLGGAAGGAFGSVIGGALGAAIPGVGAGVRRAIEPAQETIQREATRNIEQGVKVYVDILGVNKKQVNLMDEFVARNGENLPQYLVEHGLPLETTADGTKFATKQIAQQFKSETMDVLEDSLQNTLEAWKGAKYVDLIEMADAAKQKIAADPALAGVTSAERNKLVDRIVNAEIKRFGQVVDLPTANRIKRNFWSLGYDVLSKQKAPAARQVGHEVMRRIEEVTGDQIVRNINQEMRKVLSASDFLTKISGDAVKGGRLGKGVTRIVGTVAGAKMGPIGAMLTGEGLVRIVSKLGDVSRLSDKAIRKMQKAGVVPSSIKSVTEARSYLQNLLQERAMIPRLGPGAIPMGSQTIKSGIRQGVTPTPQTPTVRPDQLVLPPGNKNMVQGATQRLPASMKAEVFEPQATTVGRGLQEINIKKENLDYITRENLEAQIQKRIDAFRKEADMMAQREGAGVAYRNIEDAAGNINFVAKDFSLARAKGNMARQKADFEQLAKELLYENDPQFRAMIDLMDDKLEEQIDNAIKPADLDIPFLNEEINTLETNIKKYETNPIDAEFTASKTAQSITPESTAKVTNNEGIKKRVDEKGDIYPDGKYEFADDGYIVQKGDLVKEYMKGGGFVPAETVGKVGKEVGSWNDYLTIKKASNEGPIKPEDIFPNSINKPVDLIQEAKKYKSADEFVKAQGKPVYHGTEMKFDDFDFELTGKSTGETLAFGLKGVWFADDVNVAKGYGGNIKEAVIDTTNFHKIDANGTTLNDFRDEIFEAKKLVSDEGMDGLIIENLVDNADFSVQDAATHIFAVNKDSIKTKKQLIDIWKKANR
jgi:hypothetical protein